MPVTPLCSPARCDLERRTALPPSCLGPGTCHSEPGGNFLCVVLLCLRQNGPGFSVPQAGARVLRARPAATVGGERLIGPRPASQRSSSRHPSVHAHAPTATPARALLPRMKLNVQLTPNVGRSAGLTPRRKSTYSVRLPQNLKTNKWPTADWKPRRSHEQPSDVRGSGLRVRAVLSQ